MALLQVMTRLQNYSTDGVAQLNEDAGGDWSCRQWLTNKLLSLKKWQGMISLKKFVEPPSFHFITMKWPGHILDMKVMPGRHGGYLTRGFDDLNWLPDPPADASPPAAYTAAKNKEKQNG